MSSISPGLPSASKGGGAGAGAGTGAGAAMAGAGAFGDAAGAAAAAAGPGDGACNKPRAAAPCQGPQQVLQYLGLKDRHQNPSDSHPMGEE